MVLIVAYGNSLRRDDGAGLVLAEILEREWRASGAEVRRISVHQLAPELAPEIAAEGVAVVVFVDTSVAPPDGGELAIQVRPLVPDQSSPSLGHHLDPTVLMVYAQLLYGRRPAAWMVTIPGVDFGHGEGLSEATETALSRAPEVARYLLQDLHFER